MEDGAQSAESASWLAAYWAVLGNETRGLEFLQRAVSLGYNDPWLLRNSDYTSLHGLPEFEAIAADIRAGIDKALTIH
jgi:hypothetical protein